MAHTLLQGPALPRRRLHLDAAFPEASDRQRRVVVDPPALAVLDVRRGADRVADGQGELRGGVHGEMLGLAHPVVLLPVDDTNTLPSLERAGVAKILERLGAGVLLMVALL